MTSPTANEARHLRNAWTAVGPLEPHFRGQGAKMSNGLHNSKLIPITVSRTVNFFENRLNRYPKPLSKTRPKMNTVVRFSADRKKLVTSFPVEM